MKYSSQEEKQNIINSLRLAVKIFKDCEADYRILGSVLIVAHLNRVFRHIGDLDVVLDRQHKNCVFKKLEDHGFELIKKQWGFFKWIEAEKKGHLGFSFLLIGDFKSDYFSYRFLNIFELRIKDAYLKPTPYSFGKVEFVGIPTSSVVSGIRQSFLNPKRKLDKQVLANEMKKRKKQHYGNINVYLFGIKLPFLYDAFSFLYNIYGGVRILFGRKYETW